MKNGKSLSRREFGMAAATVAGLSLVPGWLGAASPQQKPASGNAEKTAPPAEAPSAEAEALASIVKMRYGARLDDAAMKEITRGLDGGLKGAAALRKVPLENSDEPAFVFRAWRSDRA
jgi:hypothetical protein